jgi:hypothetical protein
MPPVTAAGNEVKMLRAVMALFGSCCNAYPFRKEWAGGPPLS